MAFVHGSKSKVSIDNSGGTLVDLSPYVMSVGFPQSIDTAESSTMGTTAKTYVVGMSDATVSVEGRYDPIPDAQFHSLRGLATTTTVQWDPQGTSTGLPRYTAEGILTSYEASADIGDVGSFSAEFQITGAVTRSTVP